MTYIDRMNTFNLSLLEKPVSPCLITSEENKIEKAKKKEKKMEEMKKLRIKFMLEVEDWEDLDELEMYLKDYVVYLYENKYIDKNNGLFDLVRGEYEQ